MTVNHFIYITNNTKPVFEILYQIYLLFYKMKRSKTYCQKDKLLILHKLNRKI